MQAIMAIIRLIPIDLRGRFFGLTAISVFVGLLEMAGVASIMPFVALMSDPEAMNRSMAMGVFGSVMPAGHATPPIHVIGLAVLVLFVATNLLGLTTLWLSVKFSARLGVRLAEDLASAYFAKGYLFLRSNNPAVLGNNLTRENEKLVSGGILQLCLLVSKLIQLLLILGLLAFISLGFMAGFSMVALVLYVLSYRLLRRKLVLAGEHSVESSARASAQAYEMFAAAKELLLRGGAGFFIAAVSSTLDRYFKADAIARVAPSLPKYVIELAAFSSLLSVPIYLSWTGQEYRDFLPVMALFAYAGYRVLPCVQQVYASYSILKFYDKLADQFAEVLASGRQGSDSPTATISSFGTLQLSDVSYAYPGKEAVALSQVNLTIERGQKVAIVGASGAGKSTLLDILLGLIAPSDGCLVVDGKSIVREPFPWDRQALGYVPQSPLMIKGSVAQNIAFGIAESQIDRDGCKSAAIFACVADVIERLPTGFDAVLGEGASLSGGEVQRLAIARALYFSPDILVLDEPLSALDPLVSERLVDNLCSKEFAKTVIMVTHDWEILPRFDKIIVVDQGRVVVADEYAIAQGFIVALRDKIAPAAATEGELHV